MAFAALLVENAEDHAAEPVQATAGSMPPRWQCPRHRGLMLSRQAGSVMTPHSQCSYDNRSSSVFSTRRRPLANIYALAFIAAASGPILELWDDSTCPFRSYFGAISGTILEVDDKPI